jgi:hypothetical protein
MNTREILKEDPSLLKGERSRKHALPIATFSLRPRFEDLPAQTQEDIKNMNEQGFIIIKDAIDAKKIQEIRDALKPYLHVESPTGRNNFEGERTQRVYALLGKSRVFDSLLEHPRIVSILDGMLLPNPLLTAYQAINILPGQTPQVKGGGFLKTNVTFVTHTQQKKPPYFFSPNDHSEFTLLFLYITIENLSATPP